MTYNNSYCHPCKPIMSEDCLEAPEPCTKKVCTEYYNAECFLYTGEQIDNNGLVIDNNININEVFNILANYVTQIQSHISYIKKADIIWNEYTVYIGIAIEGTEETDESWSIMKQISNPEGDVVSLQTFSNVAWLDRYTL